MTECGNFVVIRTDDIRPIGRIAKGVKAIKLNEGDHVIKAHLVPSTAKEIVSISGAGLCKRTDIKEFSTQSKNTKGSKIQKVIDGDWIADFIPVSTESELLIAATNSCIKISLQEVPLLSRGTQGNKTIKLTSTENVVGLTTF